MPHNDRRRPDGEAGRRNDLYGIDASLFDAPDSQVADTTVRFRTPAGSTTTADLDQILFRWLQDLLVESLPLYWERRSRQLATIGTPWGDEASQACQNKAEAIRQGWDT